MFSKKILVAILLLALSQSSYATTFMYEDLSASNGGMSDRLDSVSSTYNTDTEVFTWDTTFNADPTDVNGFWLVVNNGPNPKSSDVNELAIMYGDMNTGIVTTYAYNGLNNSNSWSTPGIFLQSDTFTTTANSLSLSIDATNINAWNAPETAPDYTGIAYDQNIGIWFHISTGSEFSYDESEITGYSYSQQGWYDKSWRTTTEVPEPSTLVLMTCGLLGFGLMRRRKS